MSFKDVNEVDIENVEKYIKNDALQSAIDKLEQSVEGEFESVSFCLQDQIIEIFGEIHASNPSKFKFERGDKIRIRNIVAYVKDVVDGDGKLKGLCHFEMKRKIKPKNSLMPLQQKRKLNIRADEKPIKSIEELKSDLHRRVMDVLKLNNINTNDLNGDMVEVEPNGVYGSVHCIACKRNSKKNCSQSVCFTKQKAIQATG